MVYGDKMEKLLCELCNTDGVSGFEGEILEKIADIVLPYADKVYFDRLGNLICSKRGKRVPKKKIVYAAHADEVGMVIKHIGENGTLLFDAIGIMAGVLPTRRVRVGKNKISGVIGIKPVHLIPKSEKGSVVSESELYIDIGAENSQDAAKYVKVGDFVSFATESEYLSENKLCAKALDDRIGCAVLIELIKSELEYDSYFVFTRREELGTLGAIQATNELAPDITVICEATTSLDIYGTPDMKKVTKLGEGVALPFMDGGTLYTGSLYDIAVATAKKNNIKIQTKTVVAGGTDARTFKSEGHGSCVLGIALPCRYIHSAACVCDTSDIQAMKELVFALEKKLGGIENA